MHDKALSRAALDRAVLRQTSTDPLTVAAAGAGLAAAGAAAVFGGAIVWGVAGAALAAATGTFCANHFVRRARYVRRYVETVNAERERARLESLGRIRASLFDFAQAGAGAELAGRGLEQYQKLRAQHEAFHLLLARKLNVGELTYTRYASAVDHAYAAVTTNLSDVADRLTIIQQVDDTTTDAPGLTERRALLDAHLIEIESRLTRNDEAITALIATATAVVGLRDLDQDPERSLGPIIDDLEQLAERVSLLDAAREASSDVN